jgi:NAD(P)-dependent dehydrogenase (short-subunit alcohol dehydrogenase family)
MPDGQVVLVTGTSSGFGELISKTLARVGYCVFASMRGVSNRNAESSARLRDWAGTAGLDLQVIEMDVTDDGSVRACVSSILAATGRIDVVVNNAGGSAAGPIEAFSIEQMRAILDLNALGPMRVNKAVLPSMRERRSGLIIHISSTLGRVLPGSGGLYPASKWALEGLAESLSYQVKAFGIDAVIVEPGAFPSTATANAMRADDQAIARAYQVEQANVSRPPTQPGPGYRLPDLQEVADAVLRLVQMPAGSRPLRTVVGPIFTEGVPEYNETYERTKAHLAEVLKRPDQAVTWVRR